jgi:hypothetical protein
MKRCPKQHWSELASTCYGTEREIFKLKRRIDQLCCLLETRTTHHSSGNYFDGEIGET